MRKLRAWFFRLAGLFRRARAEEAFAAELESHIQMHIDDNLRAGMSPSEARRRALIALGGIEPAKELYRERRSLPFLETFIQDLRYAVRTLRKNPGFTAVAVLTLALGIGANTAIFSMVNALLLHPYSFPELDRLVRVWENRGIDESIDARFIAAADAADLRSATQLFSAFTTFRCGDYNLTSDALVQPVRACAVSANFFDVLGAAPVLGRSFAAAEGQPGADEVAVVSYGFWQRQFAADPSLLGKILQMNGRKYTIVGIMPRSFDFPVPMELWVPLGLSPADAADRSKLSFEALARLGPGVTVAQARKVLEGVTARLRQEYPATNGNRRIEVLQLRKELYAYTLPLFGLLQAAAGFVLLLACVNLANLLFARIFGRQKEIAVRIALGAGRWPIARLFITETFLLACLAGAVAIAASFWSVKLLRTSIATSWTMWVPGWDAIHVDASVISFSVLLSVLVGILFGLTTALHSKQVDPYAALKEAGRGPLPGSSNRLRSALVVSQVIFAFILLVCAGLTAQGFLRLVDVYRGFQATNVFRATVRLPEKAYADSARIISFYDRLLREASALPGATAAAVVTNSPASNVDNETTFLTIGGRPALRATETPSAELQVASPDYFAALRITLITGRLYTNADNADAARVVLISRSLASHFWPNGEPLGQQVKLGAADSTSPWMTVVGIVEDVRQNWWNPAARPTIYQPFFQAPRCSMVFLMRVSANPSSFAGSVRDVVHGIDEQIALNGVGTLDNEITDSIAIIRIMGVLMGLFGCVALALASVGVYGVLAENVSRRIPEIGIRLALGADPHEIRTLVFGHAVKLTAIGLAVAVPIALVVNRLMINLIFGIVSMNLLILAGFAALLIIVALISAYIPARRAMRVDPIVALRYE